MTRPDVIYLYDENRRVYAEKGQGGPIYREHWKAYPVVGETRQSWIVDLGHRQVKRSKSDTQITTAAELDRVCWVHDHAIKIADAVRRCTDFDRMIIIAAAVGYPEQPPS